MMEFLLIGVFIGLMFLAGATLTYGIYSLCIGLGLFPATIIVSLAVGFFFLALRAIGED